MTEIALGLTEAVKLFITSKTSAGLSQATLVWYQLNLDAFLRWFGAREHWPVAADIEAFQASERAKLKPISLAGRYRALNVFFGWCMERELIDANPMAKVKRPKVAKHKPRSVTIEDFDRLLSSVSADQWIGLRDRLAINVMFLCGLRVSEVAGLIVGDFRLTEGVLLVRNGKGGDDRPVPLLPAVAKAFVEYIYARPASEQNYVFVSAADDQPLKPNGLRLMLRRRCKAAGIPYMNPHSFRHGLAIYLLNQGGDMSLVQKVLGHARIQTTAEHYAKWLTTGMVEKFSEVMNRRR